MALRDISAPQNTQRFLAFVSIFFGIVFICHRCMARHILTQPTHIHCNTLQHTCTYVCVCTAHHISTQPTNGHGNTLQHTCTYLYMCLSRNFFFLSPHYKTFRSFCPCFFFNFLFSTDGIAHDTSFLVAAQNTKRFVLFVSVLLFDCFRFFCRDGIPHGASFLVAVQNIHRFVAFVSLWFFEYIYIYIYLLQMEFRLTCHV